MALSSTDVIYFMLSASILLLASRLFALWREIRHKNPSINHTIERREEGLPVHFTEMTGSIKQLLILLHDHDRHRSEPLYHQVLKTARQHGIKGASIFRGIEGFGLSKRIQSFSLFETLQHLPVMILIIDDGEKIERFLPEVEQLLSDAGAAGGIYTLSSVSATFFHTEKK